VVYERLKFKWCILNLRFSVSTVPSVYKPQPIQLKPVAPPPTLEQAKLKAQETAKKIMHEAMKNKVLAKAKHIYIYIKR
jgi:hypothetical protein